MYLNSFTVGLNAIQNPLYGVFITTGLSRVCLELDYTYMYLHV